MTTERKWGRSPDDRRNAHNHLIELVKIESASHARRHSPQANRRASTCNNCRSA